MKENSLNESYRSQCKTLFLNTFALENPIEPSCKGTQSITALSLFPPMGPLFENVLNYWMDGKKNVSVNEQRQMYGRTDGWVTEEWMVILKRQSISHTIYIYIYHRLHTHHWLKHSSTPHAHTHAHSTCLTWMVQDKEKKINKYQRISKRLFLWLFLYLLLLIFYYFLGDWALRISSGIIQILYF